MRFRVQGAHLVASLILIELLYIGIRVADPFEGWAQQFFLHRTIIQWLTMALFSFCLVFLVSRLIACRSANRSLDAFEMSHPRQRRSSSYVM